MRKKTFKATTAIASMAILSTSIGNPIGNCVFAKENNNNILKETDSSYQKAPATSKEAKKLLDVATKNKENAEENLNGLKETLAKKESEKNKAQADLETSVSNSQKAFVWADDMFTDAKNKTQTELTDAQNKLKADLEEQAKAEQDYLAKQTAYELQLQIKKTAEQKLEEAKNNVAVSEKEYNEKKSAFEEASALLKEKDTELNAAKEKVKTLNAEIQSSETILNELKEKLETAGSEKTELENALETKQAELQAAIEAYNNALKELESGNTEFQQIQAKITEVQNALDNALNDKNLKEQLMNNAYAEMQNAENLVVDTSNALAIAEKEEKIASARTVYAKTLEEYNTADNTYASLQNSYNTILNEFNRVQNEVTAKEQTIATLETQKTEAENTLLTSQSRIEELSNLIVQYDEDITSVSKNMAGMEQTLKDAQSENETAEADYNAVLKEYTKADEALKKADSDYLQAQKEAALVSGQLESGAYDFYASREQQEALDVLNNCLYNNWNEEGNRNGSTAYANVQRALVVIAKINTLRTNLGIPEYKVTDRLMAMAQANANTNWSIKDNPNQFTGVEEVNQWEEADLDNLLYGIYLSEKAAYDAGERDITKVGNYIKLIDPTNNLAGIGLATHKMYSGSNVFYKGNSDEYNKAYTVEEYQTLVNNRYNDLEAKKDAEEKAQLKRSEAYSNLEFIKSDYVKKKEIAEKSREKFDNIKAKYDALENSKAELMQKKEAASAEKQKIEDSVTDAKNVIKTNEALLKTEQAELMQLKDKASNKKELLEKEETKLTLAKENLDKVSSQKEQSANAYKSLSGQQPETNITYEKAVELETEAKEKTKLLTKKNDAASADYQQRKEIWQSVTSKYNSSVANVEEKQNQLQALKNKQDKIMSDLGVSLTEKEKLVKDKTTEADNIKNALNKATDVYNTELARYNSEKAVHDNNTARLNNLQNEQLNIQQDYDNAKDKYVLTKDAFDKAHISYDAVLLAEKELKDATNILTQREEALKKATILKTSMEEILLNDKENASKAEDKHSRAIALSVEKAINTPITDEDFLYLNDVIGVVKKAETMKADAESWLTQINDVYNKTASDYESAKKTYLTALGEVAYLQNEYEQLIKKENTNISPATPDSNTNSDKSANIKPSLTELNVSKEATGIAPVTGDRTNVNTPLTFGISSIILALYGIVFRRKKEK